MQRSHHLRRLTRAVAVAAALVGTACRGAGTLRERLAPRTPHERYAAALRDAGLDSTALGAAWLAAADAAVRSPAVAPLPLRETGTFAPGEVRAAAWRLAPRRGQRVR
ncbi:MAG TPA: hypothetical protein VEZ47_11000, partial [Gemmatirosa sp.]|nr:hypothetical protein [Gemmatirosa sp.]